MPLSRLAVVCPGQGILPRGCLHGFRKMQPLFSHSLQCIDETLQENFSRHLLDQPLARIDAWGLSTANAQPAIVASTYIIHEILRKSYGVDLASDARVSYFLGHSLGEYSALALTGVLTLEEAVCIVRKRGQLMENAVGSGIYEMRSLLFRPSSYEAVYSAARKRKVLACANNGSMVAVSGKPAQLDELVSELNQPRKTILKQTTLPVSVPFHNELLRAIEPALLECRPVGRKGTKPIVSNLTASVASGDVYGQTVYGTSAPVLWKKSVEFLCGEGVDTLVNLGPGNAVSSINSRFGLRNVNAISADDLETIAQEFGNSQC